MQREKKTYRLEQLDILLLRILLARALNLFPRIILVLAGKVHHARAGAGAVADGGLFVERVELGGSVSCPTWVRTVFGHHRSWFALLLYLYPLPALWTTPLVLFPRYPNFVSLIISARYLCSHVTFAP